MLSMIEFLDGILDYFSNAEKGKQIVPVQLDLGLFCWHMLIRSE